MKNVLSIFIIVGLLFSLFVPAGIAEDYSEYTLEQIESEISELEAKLEQLYKLRDEKQPKETVPSNALKMYSGSGDDVVILEPVDDWFIFDIEGSGDGYFGVIAYDKTGERLSALVNTTGSYHGIVFDETQSAATLEIKAKGDWTIKVLSIYEARYGYKGSKVKGNGDEVILFYTNNGKSATATIKGNADEKYFGIIGYDKTGERITAYVNTTEKYDGKVLLKGDPVIFVIKSGSDWEINFE